MRLARLTSLPAILLSLASCGPSTPERPADCDEFVTPGADDTSSVAAAIVGVEDGDTFCFAPGTYHFTDPVDFRDLEGLTVRGTGATRAEVVLDFSGETGGAKGLTFTAVNDLVIENFTVIDAPGDNIFATGSTNITMRNLTSGWMARTPPGRYAFYPVQSTNVLIENVLAYGSADAGIYVGQATNCIVRDSEARGNVAGIEIENSTNCEVVGNDAHDNTGGILVFELPGLPQHGDGTLLLDNTIVDNNVENFAEEGAIVSFLPTGTGVMILAANDVEITGNTITGNDTTGIFVITYDTAEVAGAPATSDPDYEPNSEDIWLHGNTWSGNGSMPSADLQIIAAALSITTFEDIVWDGDVATGDTDATLCIMETGATFRDADIAGGFTASTTEIGEHDCSGTARTRVTLPQDG